MIAWSVLAVGSVYAWAAVPLMAASALAAVLAAPARRRSSGETWWLDRCLIACIAATVVQLIPLPPAVRTLISPNADKIPSALQLVPFDPSAWRPISVAPGSTAYAIALVLTGLVFFWTARRCCDEGLTFRIVCGIAFSGLAAALLAIAFHGTGSSGLIYGRWRAVDKDAHPFGPFVNRNHFATWTVMACPLAAGYVAAVGSRVAARARPAEKIAAILEWLGTRSAWVSAAGLVMIVALVISTSRSGAIALGASLAGGVWLARTRLTRRSVGVGALLLLASAVFVGSYANARPLASRLREAWAGDAGGRQPIWRETNRIVRDFPLTGTGLGTYETAMLVYQQTNREIRINQAHNQYLQLFADGGILLNLPLVLAVAAFVRLYRLRLGRDTSAFVWLRIGGGAAMLAVAVQSLWETGLRIPANGLLFAAAAAVAVHRSESGHLPTAERPRGPTVVRSASPVRSFR